MPSRWCSSRSPALTTAGPSRRSRCLTFSILMYEAEPLKTCVFKGSAFVCSLFYLKLLRQPSSRKGSSWRKSGASMLFLIPQCLEIALCLALILSGTHCNQDALQRRRIVQTRHAVHRQIEQVRKARLHHHLDALTNTLG